MRFVRIVKCVESDVCRFVLKEVRFNETIKNAATVINTRTGLRTVLAGLQTQKFERGNNKALPTEL